MWVDLASNCVVLNCELYEVQLLRTPAKFPPGQACKPAYIEPTHANVTLPYTNFKGRRPAKYQNSAHMTHVQKKKEDRSG